MVEELRRLRRENDRLRTENEILLKAGAFFASRQLWGRPRRGVKFAFISANEGSWRVSDMCPALGVTRQGHYAWRRRGPSARVLAPV